MENKEAKEVVVNHIREALLRDLDIVAVQITTGDIKLHVQFTDLPNDELTERLVELGRESLQPI